MNKSIMCIDPGASGGIAVWPFACLAEAHPMPEGMTAQIDLIRAIAAAHPGIEATIENVGGYMPGNSGPAACKFSRHVGHLETALYCAGIPTTKVAPQTWMKALGTVPKDKAERKNFIKEYVARRFPHIAVTLKTSDALGMLVWARGNIQ